MKNKILNLFGFIKKNRPKKTGGFSNDSQSELEKKIDYVFENKKFLFQALTHRSYINNNKNKSKILTNERLEFLGDAIINSVVTEYLYNNYPSFDEGQLSKMKSLLVSRKVLGDVAQKIDLGNYMRVSRSERKGNSPVKKSIISNAFEAVIGAVYIDGGILPVKRILDKYLFSNINEFLDSEDNINYKSKILEMSQADGFGIPNYPLIAECGPDHAKKFVVGIEIAGVRMGKGEGTSKRKAQQKAAYYAIKRYDKNFIKSKIKKEEHQ